MGESFEKEFKELQEFRSLRQTALGSSVFGSEEPLFLAILRPVGP
jgi:hypothetical protein